MSKKLQRLFLEADEIFQETSAEIESKNEIPTSNLQTIAAELERGFFLNILQLFRVGENAQFRKNLEMFGMGEEMEKLVDYLESEGCHELLRRNKMSIHIVTGNIFFDIVNSGKK